MPSSAFSVEPFTMGRFLELLVQKSEATSASVRKKLHSTYFKSYFGSTRPRSMLVEHDYVDRDYIEDHAGFYDRCFHKYAKTCTRIHFFGMRFTDRDFAGLLQGDQSRVRHGQLQRAYRGFVVVKPLPKGIIGRTCLKTYSSLGGKRNYPIVRNYTVSLFGLRFTVQSLAFQEQDAVVAACATSALWSVFHGTGMLFDHPTPTPVAITGMATSLHTEYVPRAMPSTGLTGSQVIHAMLQLGLDPLRFRADDPFFLKSTVYAYLRARIPLLLTVALHDTSRDMNVRRYRFHRNKHAVAVTGYRLGDHHPAALGKYDFRLRASRIKKLYVHDDQVGPFARMVFDGKKINVNEGLSPDPFLMQSMRTSWRGGDGIIGHTRAIPEILFVPLYNKIRVDFQFIREVVIEFDSLIKTQFIRRGLAKLVENVEWDIFLTYVSDLKEEYLKSSLLDSDRKKKLLLKAMPKYVWRCVVWRGDKQLLELLFDATDIERGNCFLCAVPSQKFFYALTEVVAAELAGMSYLSIYASYPIFRWFRTQSK